MGREKVWLSTLDVTTPAIIARDLSGALAIPEKRGENTAANGRHGTIRSQGKKYGGREAVMEFLVFGRTAAGVVPADPKAQLYANLHELGQVLAQDVFPMIHQLPDGTLREIPVEVMTAVTPERHKVGDFATVKVAFTSASAFWRAQDVTTASVSLANNGTRVMSEFAASDAPIDDLILTFGPGPGPDLYDTRSNGLFLAYDATIASGQGLIVDCGRKRLTGTGGLIPDRTLLRTHPSDGRWFALDPVIGGAPTIRLDHGGGATPMNLTLAGKQSWMFG